MENVRLELKYSPIFLLLMNVKLDSGKNGKSIFCIVTTQSILIHI